MSSAERRTVCNRDCPDTCGIVATVENGVVTGLKGDPEHPVTRGFLCFRTSRFVDAQNSPDRLRKPLLRVDGRLVEISMEEALDHAAQQLLRIRAESGPASIFHYRSGGSLGLLKMVADRFFEQFGPCATKVGDICSGAGEAAQEADFGVSDSNDLFDLLRSRHIYLWGKNPFVSQVHLVPVIRDARSAGARVTLIDPVHHRGASLADRVVAPRPGADIDLALGIARVLIDTDRCDPAAAQFCENFDAFANLARRHSVSEWAAAADVDQQTVEALADDFANGPTAILVGWGMQRRANGAAIVRALDALSAISGNLFRPGGGSSFYFRRRGAFDSGALVEGRETAPRLIREPMFAADVRAAQDPPIRAIWVTAGNPVSMLPDAPAVAEVFEQTEFTVVVDPFLTDTGRRADLVLPAPTLLEDDDLLGAYGHHWLAESRPVVPPPDGVLHEVELFAQLARRTGIEQQMAGTVGDYKQRLWRRLDERGVAIEQLRDGPVRNPFAADVLFEDERVATPSGRVRLLDELPPRVTEDADYPLWLFSNSTEKSQASQWAGKGLGEHTWIRMHPDAAGGRQDGQVVTVESAHGRLQAQLRLDDSLRTDIALMPKGGHYDAGHSANVLIPARTTDLGLGAAYLDCHVRIR